MDQFNQVGERLLLVGVFGCVISPALTLGQHCFSVTVDGP
jgi:hypothetical protein